MIRTLLSTNALLLSMPDPVIFHVIIQLFISYFLKNLAKKMVRLVFVYIIASQYIEECIGKKAHTIHGSATDQFTGYV